MNRLVHSSLVLCAVAALAVGSVATMQPAGSPLLKELNAIAQRQLNDRAMR